MVGLLTPDELRERPPAQWLLPGYLQGGASAFMVGVPGAGKSLLALDMGLSLASDGDWHGTQGLAGPVVWIAGEDGDVIQARIGAWQEAHPGRDVSRFLTLPEPIDLRDANAVRSSLGAELRQLGEPPVLIVVDTLSTAMPGGDENGSKDPTRVLGTLGELRRQTGATTLVLHHPAKGKGAGRPAWVPRGHGSLEANARSILHVRRTGAGPHVLSVEKQSNGSKGRPLRFLVEGGASEQPGSIRPRLLPGTTSADAREQELLGRLEDAAHRLGGARVSKTALADEAGGKRTDLLEVLTGVRDGSVPAARLRYVGTGARGAEEYACMCPGCADPFPQQGTGGEPVGTGQLGKPWELLQEGA